MAQDHLFALTPGYELAGYSFGEVLGSGGYGITYKGEDLALGRAVAIKEYLPNTFARRSQDGVTVKARDAKQQELFAWGIERFRQEAETLVQLQHPNIVRVLRYFAANGTAYIVMVYEKGTSLGARLLDGATLPAADLKKLVEPLLSGIETVHKARFLHRDIKPDNIYLRGDGSPVLLDFGSARQAIGARTQAITSIVSPGYSPFEQYGKAVGDQGPWTDIYALGATLYRCIAGKRPPPALDRVGGKRPMESAMELGAADYEPALLRAIDAALQMRAEDRPQTIAALRAVMRGGDARAEPRGDARGAPVVVEPGATLVAGPGAGPGEPIRRESGATLVSGGSPDRPPAARGETIRPAPGPSVVSKLTQMRPAYLAIGAGVGFFLLMGLVILLVVLLKGR